MLIFSYVQAQNFMSVGNVPLKIELNKHQSTLITGKNGAGKSQVIEALCFALYGKPYRNINKPTLCNSINGKKCLVEVEFQTNGKKYLIKRGMKPTVFEIYESGKLLNQDADSRDYQKILEQQILKMNFRAFTQVVVIGTAAFVPFMNLKPEHRREFIEDLLDIRVFSIMNKQLSVKLKETKDFLKLVVSDIQSAKDIIQVIESHVETRKEDVKLKIENLKEEKKNIQKILDDNTDIESELNGKISKLEKFLKGALQNTNLYSDAVKRKSRIVSIIDDLTKSLHDNPTSCFNCHQDIPHDVRSKISEEIESKIKERTRVLGAIEIEVDTLKSILEDTTEQETEARDLRARLVKLNESTYGNSLLIKKINRDLLVLEDELTSETPDKSKLKETAKKIVSLVKEKKALLETQQLQLAAQSMLHDTGIKAKIIKQYIPTINKLVNKYLNKLDLFVNFNLDENFNEVVKSRHRDMFTYDSFSEGEKTRISLALIFTWRAIAAMKNSVNSNLIILDEVADASMDTEGFDQCVNLFHSMKNNNVFVVSHREIISDKFENTLRFEKKNNFTVISS